MTIAIKLTKNQIDLLSKLPYDDWFWSFDYINVFEPSSFRTFNSLVNRGIVVYDSKAGKYIVERGTLSKALFNRIYPGKDWAEYVFGKQGASKPQIEALPPVLAGDLSWLVD